MKLTSKHFILYLEEEITIGEFKTTLIAHVMGEKDSFDIEFTDYRDTSYMGIPINGYSDLRKFMDFHKQMGIDFDRAMCEKFKEVFTEEAVKVYVNKIKF